MTLFEKILFLKPVISRLFQLLNKRQKLLMVPMLVVIIGFSLVETVGISAIMPFISIVSDTSLLDGGLYKQIFVFFGFSSAETFIIAFGICIIFFYLFRGIYFIFLQYITIRYSNSIYKYYSKNVLKISLTVPYKAHSQKNTGEMMHAIFNETREVGNTVLHFLNFCT